MFLRILVGFLRGSQVRPREVNPDQDGNPAERLNGRCYHLNLICAQVASAPTRTPRLTARSREKVNYRNWLAGLLR